MKQWKAYVAIIIAMILWSTAGIATKIALKGFSPLTLVTLRFTIAIALMLIVGLASGKLQKIDRQHLPMFLLAGFVQPFLYYVCQTYGMRLMNSPTVAEVFLCTGPLIAPLFAYILIREKISWQNIVGIIISTIGVVMTLIAGNSNFSIGSAWGVALCFAAVISAVLYTIILRKFPDRYNNLSIVFYIQLSSLLFFYPLWAIQDLPDLLSQSLNISALAQPLGAIVYLAVFASVIGFILFSYTIRKIGVTRANAFNNIRPVFTAIIMFLFFGEQLPIIKWVAIVIVIAGLYICQHQPQQQPKS